MTSRVSSKNKGKKPKGKIVLKKGDQTEKQKTVQRNRKQRRRESARSSNYLTTAP